MKKANHKFLVTLSSFIQSGKWDSAASLHCVRLGPPLATLLNQSHRLTSLLSNPFRVSLRAGNGIRTHDSDLGKVVLYH